MFRYRGISNHKVFWHYSSWRTPTRLAGVLQVGFTPPAPKKGRRPPRLGTAPSTSLFKQPHAMMLQVKERRNRRPSGSNREADLPLMPNAIVSPRRHHSSNGHVPAIWSSGKYEDYRLHCFANPAATKAFLGHFGGDLFDPKPDRKNPRCLAPHGRRSGSLATRCRGHFHHHKFLEV